MHKLGLLELEFAFGSFQGVLGIGFGFGQFPAGLVEDNCDVDVETIGVRSQALVIPG